MSWLFFITILITIIVPTINVPNSSVTTREGESVTVSCVPSDPRVQLTWSSNPLFFESDVVYDSDLRHSLTVVNPRIDTTYYCQVKGQSSESPVPGLINVNVLRSKRERILMLLITMVLS